MTRMDTADITVANVAPTGGLSRRLAAGDSPESVIDAINAIAGASDFMRFFTADHGAILRLQGQPADAIRFLIGHPMIASQMTKRAIGSALYAPLSLLIASDDSGTRLEFDRPSTFFAQFGDPEISQVALDLDNKFAALIHAVAGVIVPAA